jgi:hypothetical protein
MLRLVNPKIISKRFSTQIMRKMRKRMMLLSKRNRPEARKKPIFKIIKWKINRFPQKRSSMRMRILSGLSLLRSV